MENRMKKSLKMRSILHFHFSSTFFHIENVIKEVREKFEVATRKLHSQTKTKKRVYIHIYL